MTSIQDILKKKKINSTSGSNVPPVQFFSTGLANVDKMLNGGIPKGRIIEIFGAESGGKTTLAGSVLRTNRYKGHPIIFIDLERSFDQDSIDRLGLNDLEGNESVTNLEVVLPDCGEDAFDAMYSIMENLDECIFVVDSVSAINSRAKLEEEDLAKASVGVISSMLTRLLPRLVFLANKSNSTIIFINQVRDKIGSYTGGYSTPGGHALKHACSQRIMVSRKTKLPDGSGQTAVFRVDKNKVGAPNTTAEATLFYYETEDHVGGFDPVIALFDFAVSTGIVEKAGAWCYFSATYVPALGLEPNTDDGRVRGRAAELIQMMRDDNELYEKIYELSKSVS